MTDEEIMAAIKKASTWGAGGLSQVNEGRRTAQNNSVDNQLAHAHDFTTIQNQGSGGFNDKPGAGLGGPATSDTLGGKDALASRIGELESAANSWGNDMTAGGYVNRDDIAQQAAPLQEELKRQHEMEDLKKQQLQMQLQQEDQSRKQGGGSGIIMPDQTGGPDLDFNRSFQNFFRGQDPAHAYDPYKAIREAAIASAVKVLNGRR